MSSNDLVRGERAGGHVAQVWMMIVNARVDDANVHACPIDTGIRPHACWPGADQLVGSDIIDRVVSGDMNICSTDCLHKCSEL